jgi:DNA-binding MarR family transcriptional regulator
MSERAANVAVRTKGASAAGPAAVWTSRGGFGTEMPTLAESVGFLVRVVQLQSFQLYYRKFEPSGISIGALTILGAIHANPGVRHGVLADALMVKRPNFTKVVNRLEETGLITREALASDKRSTTLHVTKKGLRKLNQMRAAIIRYHEEVASVLAPDERKILVTLLRKLSAHLRVLLGDQANRS